MKLLCLIGFHKDEFCHKPSSDGGELLWELCQRCGRETEPDCTHTFGPLHLDLTPNEKQP